MNFKSDNVVPASPEILEAITKANHGAQTSYGGDDESQRLTHKLSDIFETEVSVFLTNTGTAANCIALSTLVKPFEAIVCHKGISSRSLLIAVILNILFTTNTSASMFGFDERDDPNNPALVNRLLVRSIDPNLPKGTVSCVCSAISSPSKAW